MVGAATIFGGIGGTILGTRLCKYYDGKIKSAYLVIPACMSYIGAVILLFAINIQSLAVGFVCVFFFELMIFCTISPIQTLALSSVESHLRSRAVGLTVFIQHILGNLIAPAIIGYISDATDSLKTGMQLTWIALIVSGSWWMLGYYTLPPLAPMKQANDAAMTDPDGLPPLTFRQVVCPCCLKNDSADTISLNTGKA